MRFKFKTPHTTKRLSFFILLTLAICVIVHPFIKGKNEATQSVKSVCAEIPAGKRGEVLEGIQARGAVLLDANSMQVLYEVNSNEKLPMASTTKIMTALVASELLSPDGIVTVTKESANIEGSSIYLEEGEQVSVKTLLYGLLLESGNDAAIALAIASCKSVDAFVGRMNEKARQLNLKSTSFANPHGLHDENHYTTAYELAIITRELLKNPLLAEIVATKSYVCKNDGERARYFNNHNRLLSSYNGACGIKTGYTSVAGRCLVSCAEREGERLIAVTLGCSDDWQTHKRMLDYGFESYDSYCLAKRGGFDLSPFGIDACFDGEIYKSYPCNEKPTLSYKITYSCFVGVTVDVKEHNSGQKRKNP